MHDPPPHPPDTGLLSNMRKVSCCNQNAFEGGRSMCTTASMCMGVAILSMKLVPSQQDDEDLKRCMTEVMQIAGTGHKNLSRRITNGTRESVQASVDDVLLHANIDLQELGLVHRSYVIAQDAGTPSCQITDGKPAQMRLSGGPVEVLLYSPEQDFIPPSIVPEAMIPSKWDMPSSVVAVLTCKGHSVMLANGKSTDGYCYFDSLSGELITGMNRHEMHQLITDHTKNNTHADLLVITTKPPIQP